MGEWDELCLVSGIRPDSIPWYFVYGDPVKAVQVKNLVQELAEYDDIFQKPEELAHIIKDAISHGHERLRPLNIRLPYQSHKSTSLFRTWRYFKIAKAIGSFSHDKPYPSQWPNNEPSFVNGHHVEILRVKNETCAHFLLEILTPIGEDDEEVRNSSTSEVEVDKVVSRYTECSAGPRSCHPSFFVLEGPYYYLRQWIDLDSLPPRSTAFPEDSEPMSFDGEFYEIINSRKQRRDPISGAGLFPLIDYNGLEQSIKQYQDRFLLNRKGCRHTAEAIKAGLRGDQLVEPLLRDCRVWMWARPDIWPIRVEGDFTNKSVDRIVMSSASPESRIPPGICSLSTELLASVVTLLCVKDTLHLSQSCKLLYRTLNAPEFINPIVRTMISSGSKGSLGWLLPVSSIPGEVETCYEQLRTWIEPFSSEQAVESDLQCPFRHPEFPFIPFLKACSASWSMMNRKRLWGISKQWEELWRWYRIHGYEVDRFAKD